MKPAYQVVDRPLVTEKSMDQAQLGKYTFKVAKDANKIEIQQAIEQLFNVTVTKVNTLNVRGKKVRGRRAGKTPNWKKAVVTLKPGDTITIFEGL
jgi:large subunit ribosomal protein L23